MGGSDKGPCYSKMLVLLSSSPLSHFHFLTFLFCIALFPTSIIHSFFLWFSLFFFLRNLKPVTYCPPTHTQQLALTAPNILNIQMSEVLLF